jgi:hypothetical protein
VKPELGVAVRTTVVVLVNDAEQVVPQLIPAGAEVIVPDPTSVVERMKLGLAAELNVAPTL